MFINWIKINLKMIHVMNSCDRKEFEVLVDSLIGSKKFFYSKRYIWNIIRGRDYYKMLSHYVVEKITSDLSNIDKDAEWIIQMVMDTAKSEDIKRNFIWAIMKQIPLLTVTTIQYASPKKIESLLSSSKQLIADDAILPFILEISDLKNQVKLLEEQLEITSSIMN